MEESRRLDKLDNNLKIIKMDKMPDLIDPHDEFMRMAKSPIWTTSKMLTNFFRAFSSKKPLRIGPWKETYKKLEEVITERQTLIKT